MDNPLKNLADQNGRVNYKKVVAFARKTRLDYFLKYNKRPFLVGKELYDGLLVKDGLLEAKTIPITRTDVLDDTSFFKMRRREAIEKRERSQSITRAIFMLQKKPFNKELADTITIGRHSENDMVVADYSISREHARIIINFDEYFVIDTGSTNGTRVDNEVLERDVKYPLSINSILSFGRIAFLFMAPADLHEMLCLDNG